MPPRKSSTKGAVSVAPNLPIGVTRVDGGYMITDATMLSVTKDVAERAAVTRVPTQPRNQTPDLGGQTVNKSSVLPHYQSFENLRYFRYKSPLIQQVHAIRTRIVKQFAVEWSGRRGDVGAEVCHKNKLLAGVETPKGFEPFIERAKQIVFSPAPWLGIYTLGDLIGLLEEDLLTINRPTIEPLRHPVTQQLVGLNPVDGGIIYPVIDFVQRWAARNPDAIRGRSDDDVLSALSQALHQGIVSAEYLLVRDEIVEGVYPPGALYCFPMRTVTDINFSGYQPSTLEMALDVIAAWWMTFDHENRAFKDGVWAEMALLISGDYGPEQKANFEQALKERAMGYTNARRIPILWGLEEGDMKKFDLIPPPSDMTFQNRLVWLANMVYSVYQLDPSYANIKPWEGGQAPKLSDRSRDEEIKNSRNSGHEVDLNHIADGITRILQREIHPDLVFRFEFGKEDLRAEEATRKSRVEYDMTRNESRLQAGDDALGFYLARADYDKASDEDRRRHDDNPWNMPKDSVFVQQVQMIQQAKMADAGTASAADVADEGAGAMGGAAVDDVSAKAPAKPSAPSKPKSDDSDEDDDEDLTKGVPAWAASDLSVLDTWDTY